VGALLFSMEAIAASIPANADAFQTTPGSASITLALPGGSVVVPMEGAEFSAPGTDPFYPLTTAEVTRLNTLAPNLGLVSYQLQWVDQHGSAVGPTSAHKVGQILVPVINTTPNFDTVVQRLTAANLTAAGQVAETPIKVLMLNLQSVAPIVIGGFHYEVVAILANGSPVFDPASPFGQFTGNLKFDATAVTPAGVSGTLDLGVTGPTPTTANLGANLPSGMEALPVNFDIQFIPLDGGPALPPINNQEVIFQNTGPSSFGPVPEPSSFVLLLPAALMAARFVSRKPRAT
jgi:hypothetical protein